MQKTKQNHVTKPHVCTTVVDASGLVVGRLASYVAKRVLTGEDVIVINAEHAIITGRKRNLVERFQAKLDLRTLASQKKAPKRPRRPDTYVRRVVRGMLPWKKPKGKRAYKRLKVYIGVPEPLKDAPALTFPDAKKELRPSMKLGEFLEIFGWQHPLDGKKHTPLEPKSSENRANR
jgi:large subunit ribosomal protein L13